MQLIDVQNVSKTYNSGEASVQVLEGLSFPVFEGEFLAMVGPSGSGKSTLLSILGALNPPTSGKIIIDDIDLYQLSAEDRAKFRSEYLGFVFQQFQLIPYLTAIENVMLPLAITGQKNSQQKQAAMEVLTKVGLGQKATRLPNQLSGGEQERVAIARAIVNRPPILLADEPTGALDSKNGEEIMELFRRLNQEGQTIIMVTHNLDSLKYVNKAIALKDGKIDQIQHLDSARAALEGGERAISGYCPL